MYWRNLYFAYYAFETNFIADFMNNINYSHNISSHMLESVKCVVRVSSLESSQVKKISTLQMDYQSRIVSHKFLCTTWAWVIAAICQWMKIRSTIVASTFENSWAICITVTVSLIYSTLIWAWATCPLTGSCPITWTSSLNFQKYIV